MPFFHTETEAQSYIPPTINPDGMRTLERAIMESRDATPFAKGVIIAALRHTSSLTVPVACTMPPTFAGGTAREVQIGADSMLSSNCSTHLGRVLASLGTQAYLSHHQGRLRALAPSELPDRNIYDLEVRGWTTIWWSHVWYDRHAQLIALPTHGELATIIRV